MKTYEIFREIFNQCSNNQMRDVLIEETEVEDPDAYIEEFCKGKKVSVVKDERSDGTKIFDITIAGLRQRFTFTPLN